MIWLLFNFITIIALGFYSMMEMAAVSFSKVRLHYYANLGIKQAVWLKYLLDNPSRLFGTTLIVVNIATVSGSEFAREFYESLGLNPDFSVLTQFLLVVIFGELAPMFAARRYSQHAVMLGIPAIYFSAKVMTPFLWFLGIISKACNYLIGGSESEEKIFLSQEELLKILEIKETNLEDTIASRILNLHKIEAKNIMNLFENSFMAPSNITISQAREQFRKINGNYLITYRGAFKNVSGIAFPRDLIRVHDSKKLQDFIQEPWFVTENTKALILLNQFRANNKSVAIVLGKNGESEGYINLDDLLEEIFGDESIENKISESQLVVERSFPGFLTLVEFDNLYHVALDENLELTLAELLEKHLGPHPEIGEFIYITPFEISVKEVSLTGIKTVTVCTKSI